MIQGFVYLVVLVGNKIAQSSAVIANDPIKVRQLFKSEFKIRDIIDKLIQDQEVYQDMFEELDR